MEKEALDLILRVQSKDDKAFQELYQNYYNSVYFKAKTICNNDADAKDITQEVFIEVHRSITSLRDPNSFYSWLMMIVMSKANDHFRKNKFSTTDIEGSDKYQMHVENRVYMDPQKYIENVSEQEILMDIINGMLPKQAQLAKMIYLDEMKLSEIADALQIPLGTVKTRAARIKKELRKRIEAYEQEEGRRLHFHVDAFTPILVFSFVHPSSWIPFFKAKTTEACTYVSQHVVMSACVTSLSILSISAGVFTYQDHVQQKQFVSAQEKKEEKKVEQPVKPAQMPVDESQFQAVSYYDTMIQNSREAYYICLNFAQDEEQMKAKREEEFKDIEPVYEKLKQSNSPYYQKLVSSGWTLLYEKHEATH